MWSACRTASKRHVFTLLAQPHAPCSWWTGACVYIIPSAITNKFPNWAGNERMQCQCCRLVVKERSDVEFACMWKIHCLFCSESGFVTGCITSFWNGCGLNYFELFVFSELIDSIISCPFQYCTLYWDTHAMGMGFQSRTWSSEVSEFCQWMKNSLIPSVSEILSPNQTKQTWYLYVQYTECYQFHLIWVSFMSCQCAF